MKLRSRLIVILITMVNTALTSADDSEAAIRALKSDGVTVYDQQYSGRPSIAVMFSHPTLAKRNLRLLSSINRLNSIGVIDSEIDDETIKIFAEHAPLRELSLTQCSLTDESKSKLCKLKQLERLDIQVTLPQVSYQRL